MASYNLFFSANHISAILLISYFGNFMLLWQIFVMSSQQHSIRSVLNLHVSVTSYGFVCLKYLSFRNNLYFLFFGNSFVSAELSQYVRGSFS